MKAKGTLIHKTARCLFEMKLFNFHLFERGADLSLTAPICFNV